jgi:hypothetical protein
MAKGSQAVEVLRAVVPKKDLEALSGEYRFLLGSSMLVQNELGILLTQILLSLPLRRGSEDMVSKAQTNQVLVFLRLLAGLCWEAWTLVDKHHRKCQAFRHVLVLLESPARRALKKLEADLGSSNHTLPMVRNKLGFHYDYGTMNRGLEGLADDAVVELWLTKSRLGSRYDIGSVLTKARLDDLFKPKKGRKPGCERFLDDVMKTTKRLQRYFDGVISVILDEHPLRGATAELVRPTDTPSSPALMDVAQYATDLGVSNP